VAERLLDIAAHVLGRIELRFLGKVADLDAGLRAGLAVDLGVDPGHDPQQRGLAGAVEAEHADLGARKEGQRNVTQDLSLGRHDLADAVHRKDILGHGVSSLSRPRRFLWLVPESTLSPSCSRC
jgi:hypothetical protein